MAQRKRSMVWKGRGVAGRFLGFEQIVSENPVVFHCELRPKSGFDLREAVENFPWEGKGPHIHFLADGSVLLAVACAEASNEVAQDCLRIFVTLFDDLVRPGARIGAQATG